MEKEELIKNWLFKAEKDIETAKDLFKLKRYDWCLFIWHLAVEKALKTIIISLDKEITFTHLLVRLAKEAELNLNDEQLNQLKTITSFNIEARYDDYKLSFYQMATKEYAQTWSKICEELYNLVRRQL